MTDPDFRISKEYIVFFRFLFWLAVGAGVFYGLVRISLWTGFVDLMALGMARVVAEFEWHSLAEDPDNLRLVFHIIPSMVQAVCAGAVAGAVVGYFVRQSADIRSVLIGCLLVFAVWNVYPLFRFMEMHQIITGSKESDILIKVLEMQGVGKSESLEGIKLIIGSGFELMKICIVMLTSLLIFTYLSRRVYFSGAEGERSPSEG